MAEAILTVDWHMVDHDPPPTPRTFGQVGVVSKRLYVPDRPLLSLIVCKLPPRVVVVDAFYQTDPLFSEDNSWLVSLYYHTAPPMYFEVFSGLFGMIEAANTVTRMEYVPSSSSLRDALNYGHPYPTYTGFSIMGASGTFTPGWVNMTVFYRMAEKNEYSELMPPP